MAAIHDPTPQEEGASPTKTQPLKDLADNITETSIKRLSLPGQLTQALLSLERYLDEDEQILSDKEMMIPKFALSKAKGVVFLSLLKCGFVFAGCIGTGCVIVKTSNGSWSGPSSIACAGLSIGLLAGASKIDYIMILPNKMAVTSFMSSGQLRIGGDLSVTLGAVGRSAYSNVGAGNIGGISVVYSYSHSKGLYGGISLHGKILTVRHECNKKFYGFDANNEAILCGDIQIPYDYKSETYQQLVHILNSYCYDPNDNNDASDRNDIKYPEPRSDSRKHEHQHEDVHIHACSCKLCVRSWLNKLDETNPFNPDPEKEPQKLKKNPFVGARTAAGNRTINTVQIVKKKESAKISKTKISKETFLEATPSPQPPDDDTYRYTDTQLEIVGDEIKLKIDDPWHESKEIEEKNKDKKTNDSNMEANDEHEAMNYDPYALNVRPWDKLIEAAHSSTDKDENTFKKAIDNVKEQSNDKQTFCIDVDEDDDDTKAKENDTKEKDNDTKEKAKEESAHRQYVKPDDCHYSDYNIQMYSLSNYDENGYRINTFSLLFQIDDISYQTSIEIAGKLVSKQYVVNWPKKRDCKAVIIVTSQTYSSYMTADDDNDDIAYELRLICYDERDDDIINYCIDVRFSNIKQIVNAINGAFVISPARPWIVLESIFNLYHKKMHESMINISTTYDNENILKYGDLIRANFGSLCQYAIYVGDGEIVCFRRRFPNNASSAFKKYRLFLMVFSGKASKKITMKYMTFAEFISDCGRIEVIYYPIPSISPLAMVKRALIATDGEIHNCIVEYSAIIQSRRTLTPREKFEDSVLSVINTITEAVNPITQ